MVAADGCISEARRKPSFLFYFMRAYIPANFDTGSGMKYCKVRAEGTVRAFLYKMIKFSRNAYNVTGYL